MYNEEQKTRFINSYTTSGSTNVSARNLFNRIEPYEKQWGADLCTRSAQDVKPLLEELTGLRVQSKYTKLSILYGYVRWCIAEGVPGACDGLIQAGFPGVEKIRRQMLSGPVHLQRCLDQLFDAESMETIDNLYRCYFWLAFGGMWDKDVLSVRQSDVDLYMRHVRYGNGSVQIYPEAVPAFINAMELKDFAYYHSNYGSVIRRDRVPGDLLFRGIKANNQLRTTQAAISQHVLEAIRSGKTDMRLSFRNVQLSGIFYRIYEKERAGTEVNFNAAAADRLRHNRPGQEIPNWEINRVSMQMLEDYRRWKLAFSV